MLKEKVKKTLTSIYWKGIFLSRRTRRTLWTKGQNWKLFLEIELQI